MATDWKAVGLGFAAGSLLQLLFASLFFDVTVFGTVSGGFIAGYLADGGAGRGAWHGFLSAMVWALVVVPLGAILVLFVSAVDVIPPFVTVGGVLLLALAIVVLAFVALFSALAGALGAVVKGR